MTDLEISKALALAIGWKDCNIDPDVITICGAYDPEPQIHCWQGGNWHRFDYRDWNVIGPIAEKFDCFPRRNGLSRLWWPPQIVCGKDIGNVMEDAPQKAIAMAVLGAKI